MDKRQNNRGQTVVELALVLPCFCLGVFMGVQLMWYCHNMIELQRAAQVMNDRVTYENYRAQKNYTRFNSLWGRFTAPQAYFTNTPITPWRKFAGVSTIEEAGGFIQVHVDTDLLPGLGFTKDLAKKTQQAFAETYLEPPIPPEQ